MRANVLTLAAALLSALTSASGAIPVWSLNYNTQINLVDPTTNIEFPFLPSPFISQSLAADPAGILYVADPAGAIFSVQGMMPIGATGFSQVADLSYSSGGLWGFSNASDTLFFFDLGLATVTYSLPITSGLTGFDITGVTQQQSTGDIYLSGNTGLNQDYLFELDLNLATANQIGSMTHADALSYISDIEFTAAGNLLAMTWYHRDFYAVNPANASTTLLSSGPHRDVTGLAVDTAQFPAEAGSGVSGAGPVGGCVCVHGHGVPATQAAGLNEATGPFGEWGDSSLATARFLWHITRMVDFVEPIQIHTRPALDMDDDQFFDFCQINGDLRIERTSEGDILIMSPEAASSGRRGSLLTYYFEVWAQDAGSGQVFSSSTGFTLPNRAMRSPDIAWVSNRRLKTVPEKAWDKFLPLCPDFVLELRSPTDRLPALQKKMEEYIANGARLGWLLDPIEKQVHVYRPKRKPQILDNPKVVAGDPVLAGFRLEVPKIWNAMKR